MNRFLYSLLLYLTLPFVPLKLIWRGIKQPAYLKHWGERFGFYNTPVDAPIIWLHCVSVGETRAAEPLVQALQIAYPNYQILITNTTPTGREASEALFGDTSLNNKVLRVYLPYDLPFAVNNFLTHFKPKIGLLMETELWFNLIAACKQHEIALLLLNARLSEKSAHGYAKLGKLTSEGLQSLSAVAAQTAGDFSRFQTLQANNISVAGNLKFDVKPPADAVDKGLQLRKLLGQKRIIFLAASTRKGEEKHILEAVKGLDILTPNLLTIIVPRHPQRFNDVESIIQNSGLTYQRRSNLVGEIDKNIQVILGDSMGELFTYYATCDFAFVGGSLLEYGGQNLIEPASMGKPILIGPHTFNFADATENAIRAKAAIRVKNMTALRDKIQYLLHNAPKRVKMGEAALNFSEASTGATARMMKLIAQYLHT
jgi:3-deoxy-D-manno-octulosonic-acid transferase